MLSYKNIHFDFFPGMRKPGHAKTNMKTSDDGPLDPDLMKKLENHRWDRKPNEWSQ